MLESGPLQRPSGAGAGAGPGWLSARSCQHCWAGLAFRVTATLGEEGTEQLLLKTRAGFTS